MTVNIESIPDIFFSQEEKRQNSKYLEFKVQNINEQIGMRSCCSITALAVGAIFLGLGGFGSMGLLHSFGLYSLPHSMQGIAHLFNAVGNTTHFWSLWTCAAGGLVIGGIVIGFGSFKLYKTRKLKKQLLANHTANEARHQTYKTALETKIASMPQTLKPKFAYLKQGQYQKLSHDNQPSHEDEKKHFVVYRSKGLVGELKIADKLMAKEQKNIARYLQAQGFKEI